MGTTFYFNIWGQHSTLVYGGQHSTLIYGGQHSTLIYGDNILL